MIYELSECEILIQVSQRLIILYTVTNLYILVYTKEQAKSQSLQIPTHSDKISEITHSLDREEKFFTSRLTKLSNSDKNTRRTSPADRRNSVFNKILYDNKLNQQNYQQTPAKQCHYAVSKE